MEKDAKLDLALQVYAMVGLYLRCCEAGCDKKVIDVALARIDGIMDYIHYKGRTEK